MALRARAYLPMGNQPASLNWVPLRLKRTRKICRELALDRVSYSIRLPRGDLKKGFAIQFCRHHLDARLLVR